MYLTYVKDGDNGGPSESEILAKLLKIPIGNRYLIIYENIGTFWKVYSGYVKSQIKDCPNSIMLILPYYDSTEKVREMLESNGINTRENEELGNLIILDIQKVIKDQYYDVPELERIRALTSQVHAASPDKTIIIIADMSVFNHTGKPIELLEYERTLDRDLEIEKRRELCFYNERDFDTMFTKEQGNELMKYHGENIITI